MGKITSDGAVFSGKTATFTSPWIKVEDYDVIALHFVALLISGGNGVFTVDGSNTADPTANTMVTGISFQDAVALTSKVPDYVVSKTLSSNGSAGAYLRACGFRFIRVVVTITTDGSYSCFIGGRKLGLR